MEVVRFLDPLDLISVRTAKCVVHMACQHLAFWHQNEVVGVILRFWRSVYVWDMPVFLGSQKVEICFRGPGRVDDGR